LKFQSAGARIAGNSAAIDEGRALATRWREKKCHGGIPYQVSHLLISAATVTIFLGTSNESKRKQHRIHQPEIESTGNSEYEMALFSKRQ
jgi:hypothetical protein